MFLLTDCTPLPVGFEIAVIDVLYYLRYNIRGFVKSLFKVSFPCRESRKLSQTPKGKG